MNLQILAITFVIMIVSLSIHEAAHAWSADKLGDPTARILGRVTLNPIVHVDPIGTILLPLVSAFTGAPLIGWAKPVPVNVSRLRHGPRDFVLVAAAGPISNLLQAFVGAVVLRIAFGNAWSSDSMVDNVLAYYVSTNLLLAFFNLIPVPPLDGGNVLAGLLPSRAAAAFDSIRQFGFIVLYGLLISGVVSALIEPPTQFFERILLP